MLGTVFASAFAFEMVYDTGMNKVWDSINRGVRPLQYLPDLQASDTNEQQRQWKDIRAKYVEAEE
ncbi:uncharacterized protein E0L32_001061 [Thyridium curvatum]|uniref:Complex III subunit 9 n=1 Tax=Thyridium curvatum TaxID=1093900 RepID=A0A507AU22_9PEZI|nr:uncharacterized protein E0L32_001061 [Thyridium curvatum]TPX11243.1 hypothetical protein E0L32_001061 [Thyridium curvatum]